MKCYGKIAVIFMTFLLGSSAWISSGHAPDPTLAVTRVIEGETLQLSSGEKVRLIGIDNPEASNNSKNRRDSARSGQDVQEIVAMGKKASEFTRNLVRGREIHLEYDVQRKDPYGRILAYVYAASCGKAVASCLYQQNYGYEYVTLEGIPYIFVNASIVKAGYAQVYTVPPNVKYQGLFLKMQREAREKKRGLWNE